MSPKITAVIAVVTTSVIATLLAAYTTTPELMTQLFVGAAVLVITSMVLRLLFSLAWMRGLRPQRQRLVIWIAAAVIAALVCFLPMALLALRR